MSFLTTRRSAALAVISVAAVGLVMAVQPTANAAQHGTNYCVSATVPIHADADASSRVVGQMPVARAWHHYWGVGGWSLGYVRGRSETRGYIPRAALTRDLGNGSSAHFCASTSPATGTIATPEPAIRSEKPRLSASATRRYVCAQTASVRIADNNQPIAILYRGEEFDLDHYGASTAYAVGYARGNENVNGMIIANTVTDAQGRCKAPYASVTSPKPGVAERVGANQ